MPGIFLTTNIFAHVGGFFCPDEPECLCRNKPDRPDRIFAVDDHCGNFTPRVRGG